tara:strand:+ start:957 stop:1379 length:423 start_codon:yes stop_codon:yes gene_type:complete
LKFKRSKEYDLSINITPLVDIVFLLLIFFIITAVLERNYLIEVDLPRGIIPASEPSEGGIEVIVSRIGEYFVNGESVLNHSETELKNKLLQVSEGDTSFPVILYADGEVSHRVVVNVMSIINDTGFTKLKLAFQSTEELK